VPAAGIGDVAALAQIPAGAGVTVSVSTRVAAGALVVEYALVATPDAQTADPDPQDNRAVDRDPAVVRVFASGFE